MGAVASPSVLKQMSSFCDISPETPIKVTRRMRSGTVCLHLRYEITSSSYIGLVSSLLEVVWGPEFDHLFLKIL